MADSPAAAIARRYFDSVARHDLDEAMACWVPGGIDHLAPVGELRVPDELRAYFEELFAAMPDFAYEVTSLIEEGDLRKIRMANLAIFTGRPYAGINANGSTISTEGADLDQVEDGLIKRLDSYWDDSAIARQIGVLPARKSGQERMLLGLFNTKTRLKSLFGRRRRAA